MRNKLQLILSAKTIMFALERSELSIFPLHKNCKVSIAFSLSDSLWSHRICIFRVFSYWTSLDSLNFHFFIFVDIFISQWTFLQNPFSLLCDQKNSTGQVQYHLWCNFRRKLQGAFQVPHFLGGEILTSSPLAPNIRFWVGVNYSFSDRALTL